MMNATKSSAARCRCCIVVAATRRRRCATVDTPAAFFARYGTSLAHHCSSGSCCLVRIRIRTHDARGLHQPSGGAHDRAAGTTRRPPAAPPGFDFDAAGGLLGLGSRRLVLARPALSTISTSAPTGTTRVTSSTPGSPPTKSSAKPTDEDDVLRSQAQARERRDEERQYLLEEARRLTLSLYRTCLRSIRIIRAGNDRDFEEFDRRERELLDEFSPSSTGGGDGDGGGGKKKIDFNQIPFVDRKDELRSRADYYADWTLENIVQESDCLDADPWMGETDVNRFLYHLRNGEEKRRFVLGDYGFDDPFSGRFDRDAVDAWEGRAVALVDETYAERGWERPRGYDAAAAGSAAGGAAGAHMDFEDDDEDWGDDDY